MRTVTRKVGLALALTASASLLLVGCAGNSSSGTLDKAACDALLSKTPAPAAAAAATPITAKTAAYETSSIAQQAPAASAPSSVKTAAEKKTITFVGGAYTSTTAAYWKDLASKFEAANPGYKVNVQIIDWNNIDQQVATMIQTKQYPDILNENKFSGWAQDGILQPASSLV